MIAQDTTLADSSWPAKVFPTEEAACEACLNFVIGRPARNPVTCLPCDDPRTGLLGVIAWYQDPHTGDEVSQTFQWPLMPGRDPLKTVVVDCTTLAELGPPTDDDLPCDNPLALVKGWVRYDWDRGVAELRQIRVRDLKNIGPHEPVLAALAALDTKAKANQARILPKERFIDDLLWKPLLTEEWCSGNARDQLCAIEDFRCLRSIAQALRQAETP